MRVSALLPRRSRRPRIYSRYAAVAICSRKRRIWLDAAAKYTEHKPQVCAKGVFRSQSPRALFSCSPVCFCIFHRRFRRPAFDFARIRAPYLFLLFHLYLPVICELVPPNPHHPPAFCLITFLQERATFLCQSRRNCLPPEIFRHALLIQIGLSRFLSLCGCRCCLRCFIEFMAIQCVHFLFQLFSDSFFISS